MHLAKELGDHIHPTMIVFPLGLLGIVPALTLLFVAFGLVLLAGWLGDELVKHLGVGVDRQAGVNATRVLGGGPTRW